MRQIIVAVVLCLGLAAGRSVNAAENRHIPPLADGDLIFQTSTSSQSLAILVATADRYTHMGIIKRQGENAVVVEAGRTVREVPLQSWIGRGLLGRFAVYRDASLTDVQKEKIKSAAAALYGKSYDIFFSFNNDAIYCSELPYLAYKAAGLEIGTIQKVSDLHFDNAVVRRLIRQRWQRYPECTTRNLSFEGCYDFILHQDLVTPASIADDKKFRKIYTNYPF